MGAILRTAVAVCVLLVGAAVCMAEEKTTKDKPDASLEAYIKAAKVGPSHKLLEPMNGSWTCNGKYWGDPTKDPQEIKGTCERKWILGGRFLQDEVESGSFGEKFNGFGLTGYDNLQGKYTAMWVDSMSTAIGTSIGTVDSTGKVFTFTKEHQDPTTKQPVKGKDVIRILDDDKHVMEMYTVKDGKEVKVMELTFNRKGK